MAERAGPARPADEAGPLAGTRSSPPKPEEVRRAGPLLIAGFVALLLCAFVLAVLAAAVRGSETYALDTAGNAFLHGFASPGMDVIMNTASLVGRNLGLLAIAVVAAVVLVRARRHREALFLGVVLGGSFLLNWAMKLFFHRARPVLPWAVAPPDYSFPSGHAMNSMALGLAIGLVAWRLLGPRWGAASLALGIAAALVIGLSRIYLGVHYVTDVVGGFATAALWVGIVVAVFRAAARARGGARPPANGQGRPA